MRPLAEKLRWWLAAAIAWSSPAVAQSGPDLRGLDGFVTGVMAEWKVPGLAVAAIKNGQVVISKGFGYRDVERKLPVTARTLMGIGSNSKSFTVTLLGMLVDEGKLKWDEPVRTYLSDFQLHDEVATRLMTARDLVTHRSGLPRHDYMWYGRSYSGQEIYARLRYLEPSSTFRQRYQYNNLMFIAAGVLAERITGRSWEELIHERIFTPLGMKRSNTTLRLLTASDEAALGYHPWGDQVVRMPYRNKDALGPAGSVNSSVEEMIRYVQMHLDQGSHEGKRIISRQVATEMQSVQSAILGGHRGEPDYPEIGPGGYGLALFVTGYRGRKLVEHRGRVDGFVSLMSWMPDEKTGVVVLTNRSGPNPVPGIVERNVYDRLLDLTPIDWNGRTRVEQAETRKTQAENRKKEEAERKVGTAPTHPLAEYAGTYRHPGYGVLEVVQEGETLKATLGQFTLSLEHYHYDVFRSREAPVLMLGPIKITFGYGEDGRIDRAMLPLEPAVADIAFERTTR